MDIKPTVKKMFHLWEGVIKKDKKEKQTRSIPGLLECKFMSKATWTISQKQMVPLLPPAVPLLFPVSTHSPLPGPGSVMSWKARIFSFCGVGRTLSLSAWSESRKSHWALACSCHVTPLSKHNANFTSCIETSHWSLQTSKLRQHLPPHGLFL